MGLWDGQYFNTFGVSSPQFGGVKHKQEGYYTAEDGCFQPFMLIDEGVVVEAVDPEAKPPAWGAHYARKMRFTRE